MNDNEGTAATMADFLTADDASQGVRLPLFTREGKPTKHWLLVRGIDSPEFSRARTKQHRKVSAVAQLKTEEEKESALEEMEQDMNASLIAGWSFDEPFSEEAVKTFLRKAPQIAREVEKFASNRAAFFGKLLDSLNDSPNGSSI